MQTVDIKVDMNSNTNKVSLDNDYRLDAPIPASSLASNQHSNEFNYTNKGTEEVDLSGFVENGQSSETTLHGLVDVKSNTLSEVADKILTNSETIQSNYSNSSTSTLTQLEQNKIITEQDIESLVGQMTKEQYDEFVNGVNTYYDQQIEYLTNVLDGENGLNVLKSQIENIYQMVRSNDIQNQELNRMIQEQFSYLGITSYDEFLNLREDTARQTELLQQALDNLINCKNSAKFDYLYYLEDYEAFIPTTVDIDSYIAGVDKECCLNFQNGEPLNLDYKTYSYNQFKQLHPEVSPVQFLLILNKTNPFGNYAVSDLDNYEQILSIGELSELVPNFAKTYEYLYSTDPDKAAEFLRDCKHEINNCKGQLLADRFLDKLKEANGEDEFFAALANELGVSVQGLKDGINSFNNGMYFSFEAFMTGLGLMEENRVLSEEEYKKMYILQGLLSTEAKEAAGLIYKDESGEYQNSNPSSIIDYTKTYAGALLSNNYEISQGIGNMLPSMLISATCPILGSVIMGFSSGGNAYHSAMVDGSDYLNSVVYGILTGYSEAVTERILGGLPGLSDIEVTSLGTYLQSMGKEGFQEIFQGVLDSLVQAEVLGKPLPNTQEGWEAYFQDLIKQGAYGAVTAGILQSPSILRIINGNSGRTNVETEQILNLEKGTITRQIPDSIGDFYSGIEELSGLSTEEKIIEYFKNSETKLGNLKEVLINSAKCGNTDALIIIDAFNKGIFKNITITVNKASQQTYYDLLRRSILIGGYADDVSIIHEFGHAIYDLIIGQTTNDNSNFISKEFVNNNKDGVISRLKECGLTGDLSENIRNKYIEQAEEIYAQQLAKMGKTKEQLLKETEELLSHYSTEEEAREEAQKEINKNINYIIKNQLMTEYEREFLDWGNRIQSVVDSELKGIAFDENVVTAGHGKAYYAGGEFKGYLSTSIDEAFADFFAMKITNNTGVLETLRYIVGDEYYNFLEELYNGTMNKMIGN